MAAENPPTTLILIVVCLAVFLHRNVNAMSSIKAMSKDQIACEFCSACDNPCQPAYSPPPPPPPSHPLPPPPSSNCPPPPSPPPVINNCPSPPSTGGNPPPVPNLPPDTIQVPNLPPDTIPILAPPNPIVPYFPFYYYSPPQPGYSVQNSANAPAKPTDSILYLLLLFLISYSTFFQI